MITGCSKELGSNDKNSLAYSIAKQTVTERLKAPSTAKFQSYDSSNVKSLGDNKYQVKGYVDAENGFGANLRNNFVVEVQLYPDKGTYKVLKFNLK